MVKFRFLLCNRTIPTYIRAVTAERVSDSVPGVARVGTEGVVDASERGPEGDVRVSFNDRENIVSVRSGNLQRITSFPVARVRQEKCIANASMSITSSEISQFKIKISRRESVNLSDSL